MIVETRVINELETNCKVSIKSKVNAKNCRNAYFNIICKMHLVGKKEPQKKAVNKKLALCKNLPFPFMIKVMVLKSDDYHCVKNVQIWRYLWSVFSRIWTEYEEILEKYLEILVYFRKSARIILKLCKKEPGTKFHHICLTPHGPSEQM